MFDFATLAQKFEFAPKVRIKFYTRLSQLLSNGVSLTQGLQLLENTASARKGSALGPLYRRLRMQMAGGKNFGDVLNPYVTPSESILLEAGANSGRLTEALEQTRASLKTMQDVSKTIKGQMAYPMLLIVMLIGALVLASFNVFPTFETILPRDQWRGLAANVSDVAYFIRERGYILLAALIAIIVIISLSLPYYTGPLRVKMDNVFPYNIYRAWQGSSFLIAVASLMSAGVRIDETSLRKMMRQSKPYLAQRIGAVRRRMAAGDNFGEALHNARYEFPDKELIGDMRVYAGLKGFDKNIYRITEDWMELILDKIKTFMQVLNILVLILIAVVIGMMITAFYEIFQQIQSQT